MKYTVTLAWLYPDLMSTYGDRGNILVLQKRCEWRGITVTIQPISIGDNPNLLASCSLLMMGGAEDRQQEIVANDFQKGKNTILKELIEKNVPGVFVCGAYQFLGRYYKSADGKQIPGLGILDMYSKSPDKKAKRLIGNIAIEASLTTSDNHRLTTTLVGFENHGGRTYLSQNMTPLGRVIKGFGNNGEDGTEGALYRHTIGSYLHGPILPKNPQLADWLIQKALEVKYKTNITLEALDDTLEQQARTAIARQMKIQL